MAKAGRPSLYKEEYNELVYKLCLLGSTDKEIADIIGVEETTINNWKLNKPGFFESLKKGKDVADAEVANKLYQRAKGFTKTTTRQVQDKQGEVVDMITETYYPPDPVSIIFWLKNRQPQKWRDKQVIENDSNEIKELADEFKKHMT